MSQKIGRNENPKLMTTILTETDEDYQGDEFSNKLYVRIDFVNTVLKFIQL